MAEWDYKFLKSFCSDTVTDIEAINLLISNLKIPKNYNQYEMEPKHPQQCQHDYTPEELEVQKKEKELLIRQKYQTSYPYSKSSKSSKSSGSRGGDGKEGEKSKNDPILAEVMNSTATVSQFPIPDISRKEVEIAQRISTEAEVEILSRKLKVHEENERLLNQQVQQLNQQVQQLNKLIELNKHHFEQQTKIQSRQLILIKKLYPTIYSNTLAESMKQSESESK